MCLWRQPRTPQQKRNADLLNEIYEGTLATATPPFEAFVFVSFLNRQSARFPRNRARDTLEYRLYDRDVHETMDWRRLNKKLIDIQKIESKSIPPSNAVSGTGTTAAATEPTVESIAPFVGRWKMKAFQNEDCDGHPVSNVLKPDCGVRFTTYRRKFAEPFFQRMDEALFGIPPPPVTSTAKDRVDTGIVLMDWSPGGGNDDWAPVYFVRNSTTPFDLF